MKATKKPITIEYFPLERKYYNNILNWGTNERPIEIITPRCMNGISECIITTLEGEMKAIEGKDVIIKGIDGEVYPCKKDIFEKTYDLQKSNIV